MRKYGQELKKQRVKKYLDAERGGFDCAEIRSECGKDFIEHERGIAKLIRIKANSQRLKQP